MSVEAKVLSASTRANVEALKHHMKKLGFKYYEEMNGWVTFGTHIMMNGEGVAPYDYISISVRFMDIDVDLLGFDLINKLPEAEQAILDFYEAEGIKE
ncbi:hypothetical protein DKZ23_08895 [Limosilactobacillus reuteri]|uniref:Uncharacterized protein n=1 Tax=Limosilactobacillus reuteri TaxID=1598 RepID=A0A317GED5_LIMRT|nr:hypothetical protein [Limosilactobacillus reuteri]MCH5384555.1 hypothetical protein [Limosilactobacillus reuteri]PWT45727.1 hypothetical protein DKZ23_08895 [Limosilactobacillus reuteri]PWT48993.1 hypothetical protein DKZ33_08980 [Limosilactobacillus reuteri]PWT60907.1 hypothetical protein DKZ32_08905 [Limosilactobacillus reuteri]